MSRPGTRSFVGPLTPSQQRRRQRNRETFRDAAEIADARNIPMKDAFTVARWERFNRFGLAFLRQS